jgi:hypothetical protein
MLKATRLATDSTWPEISACKGNDNRIGNGKDKVNNNNNNNNNKLQLGCHPVAVVILKVKYKISN